MTSYFNSIYIIYHNVLDDYYETASLEQVFIL
ncbi:Uncharacterised protein [Legionella cherrii]|uniref:Uncharacterized protein n=1 Tax=Legionella cherrii TaxID=28084 RepID=A0ABY6T2Y7_9GAMM|nr:Uncharacterised protein [Legionella cherrii]